MKKINLVFVIFLLIIFSSSFGYYFGKRGYEVSFKKTPIEFKILNKTPTNANLSGDFAMFWKVFDDLNNKHIDKPFDAQKLIQGAIKGMVDSAEDPFTIYLSPDENKSSDERISGEYEGIGAELGIKDGIVLIVAPIDDTPAQKAGLKPGDLILKVDEIDVVGMPLNLVVNKIKGPKNTKVTLNIKRGDDNPINFEIIRDAIKLVTVKSELKNANTAYLRISMFSESTNSEWDKQIRELVIKNPNLKSIILDLRSNPGGLLNSAVYVASSFMQGVAVKEEFYDGTVRELTTEKNVNPILKDKKLFVLIDEGSASASEILAGTLREKASAVLIGKKSFGKGTVQEPIDYSDGGGLNVTIAKWLTPGGFWVHKQGIKPDFEVEITEKDFEEKRDTQLEKALEMSK